MYHMNIRCQFNRLEREMKKICRNINMQMEWMSIRCRGRAYAFYFHVEKNVLARSQEHVNRFTIIDIELGRNKQQPEQSIKDAHHSNQLSYLLDALQASRSHAHYNEAQLHYYSCIYGQHV